MTRARPGGGASPPADAPGNDPSREGARADARAAGGEPGPSAGAARPSRAARLALGVLAAGLAVAAAGVAFLRPAGGVRPNVILIVWDTCRGDRVEVNGYARPTTPRLAAFARDAVTFRECRTPAPWTAPAHASLFTGLLPRGHRMREGMGDTVRPGIPLLARTLREAGYETVSVSANPVVSTLTGLTDGFEHDFQRFRIPGSGVTGNAVRDQVRSWGLRRRSVRGDRRPVFLFVNLMETHLPYVAEPSAVAAVHGDAAVGPATAAAAAVGDLEAKLHVAGVRRVDDGTVAALSLAYDGAVREVDRITGEILDFLDGEGLLDGALVAICSDHGENLGEHGELNHAFSVYEPVLHVPLVVRWPGRLDGGRTEDAQVRLHDLYATILQATGVPTPAGCGLDSVPLTEFPLRPRPVIAEYGPMARSRDAARAAMPDAPEEAFASFGHLFRAVIPAASPGAPRPKLVLVDERVPGRAPVVVREELFDLTADPREQRDLLGAAATEAARDAAGEVARALRALGEAGR